MKESRGSATPPFYRYEAPNIASLPRPYIHFVYHIDVVAFMCLLKVVVVQYDRARSSRGEEQRELNSSGLNNDQHAC